MIDQPLMWFKTKIADLAEKHLKLDALLEAATKLAREAETIKHKAIQTANGHYIPSVVAGAGGISLKPGESTKSPLTMEQKLNALIRTPLEGTKE